MNTETSRIKIHTLSLVGEKLSATGVTEVKSFDPKTVVLQLDGRILTVKGQNLAVTELTLSGANFSLSGEVHSLCYSKSLAGGNFLSKLTK